MLSKWYNGIQISQFCTKGLIIYYYDTYSEDYFNEKEEEYRKINDLQFCGEWYHYIPINTNRFFLTKHEFTNINLLKK